MPEPVTPAAAEGVLVLITGTGRSGTSTMSGTLHHLGLHVPGPFLGANESNPKGFFESRWALRFHKRVVRAAGIHDMDSRPEAFDRAQAVITPELRAELRAFLERKCVGHRQSVVKDPRSVWTQQLWHDTAAELGLDVRYVSMLRHPAEVVGSRRTYYASQAEEEQRRHYEIFNVSRWINSSLVSERHTRGRRRAFVQYNDLLEDWRPAVIRVAEELGLELAGDLTPGSHHPVDDFIDPGLRRVRVTWDELVVPDEQRDIAQGIWDQLMALHAAGGRDEAAQAALDELSERYTRLFEDSAAIAHDAVSGARIDTRAAVEKEQAERRPAEARPAGRLVEETDGRGLLREVGRRARGKLVRAARRG